MTNGERLKALIEFAFPNVNLFKDEDLGDCCIIICPEEPEGDEDCSKCPNRDFWYREYEGPSPLYTKSDIIAAQDLFKKVGTDQFIQKEDEGGF